MNFRVGVFLKSAVLYTIMSMQRKDYMLLTKGKISSGLFKANLVGHFLTSSVVYKPVITSKELSASHLATGRSGNEIR